MVRLRFTCPRTSYKTFSVGLLSAIKSRTGLRRQTSPQSSTFCVLHCKRIFFGRWSQTTFPSLEDLTVRYGVLTDTAITLTTTGNENFDEVGTLEDRKLYVHKGHPRHQISPAMVAILGTLLY
eukprot:PhM_4_TR16817/c3_g1_i1/m.104556